MNTKFRLKNPLKNEMHNIYNYNTEIQIIVFSVSPYDLCNYPEHIGLSRKCLPAGHGMENPLHAHAGYILIL